MLIDTTEDGPDQKCCPGRDTDAPALGTWNQLGQSQKSFYTKSNSAIESLNTFFTTSGLLIDTTEDGTDQKCCSGRDTDAPALGTWNLQTGQSQNHFAPSQTRQLSV